MSNHHSQPFFIKARVGYYQREKLWVFIDSNRDELQTSLFEKGSILIRGYHLRQDCDLKELLDHLFPNRPLQTYRGGLGHKKDLGKGLYTSTEVPSRFDISLHQEMAYLPQQPRYIAFFCKKPSSKGGRTPILCGHKLYRVMDEDIRDTFEQFGIRYVRTYPTYGIGERWGIKNPILVNWQNVFDSKSKEEVEVRCAKIGLETKWLQKDLLQTSICLPSTRIHPESQLKIWNNQAHTFIHTRKYLGTFLYGMYKLSTTVKRFRQAEAFLGNGDIIPNEMIDRIHTRLKENQYCFEWQAGDILILDNWRMLHGREAYTGKREVLSALL